MKLAVDIGVLTITLTSLAIRQPFTLQYAREIVSPEAMNSPDVRRMSYVITSAWTIACLLMATGNILMIYIPGMPFWAGIAIATAARFAALYFTAWYRHRHRLTAPAKLPLNFSSGA